MKHTLKRWLGAFLLAMPLAGISQSTTSPVTPVISSLKPFEQFTLANGLTVIVKPDRRAPTAVHMLWVRVGAVDEVDGTSGVAHVLEHMLFKSTPKYPRLWQDMANRGFGDLAGLAQSGNTTSIFKLLRLDLTDFAAK